MKLNLGIKAACASMLTILSACAQHTAVAPYPEAQTAARAPASGARAVVSGQRTSFDSVDSYKYDVAEHIMRYNGAHTFSGKLPPMLPAVVVLSITVDQSGRPTKVTVQRSRDNDASKVALASMQRAGQLPRPFNLATGPGKSLTFSETFLFNADYRFQLRTLAPIQTSD
jgi:protein TonB